MVNNTILFAVPTDLAYLLRKVHLICLSLKESMKVLEKNQAKTTGVILESLYPGGQKGGDR